MYSQKLTDLVVFIKKIRPITTVIIFDIAYVINLLLPLALGKFITTTLEPHYVIERFELSFRQ